MYEEALVVALYQLFLVAFSLLVMMLCCLWLSEHEEEVRAFLGALMLTPSVTAGYKAPQETPEETQAHA